MNNKKQIESFLAVVLKTGGEHEPPKMSDKHGRAMKRSTFSMYINQIGCEAGVKFYTRTNLSGLLVVGVRT